MYALPRQEAQPDRWAITITIADPDGYRLILRYQTWR